MGWAMATILETLTENETLLALYHQRWNLHGGAYKVRAATGSGGGNVVIVLASAGEVCNQTQTESEPEKKL